MLGVHNAIKSVTGLRPSTGRPCQGAVYCWLHGLPLRSSNAI